MTAFGPVWEAAAWGVGVPAILSRRPWRGAHEECPAPLCLQAGDGA